MAGDKGREKASVRLAPGGTRSLRGWLIRHLQSFFYTLGMLFRAPLATIMTTAVIGVALALPSGLYLLLENVRDATRGWDAGSRISLFLKSEIDDAEARALAESLADRPQVASARLITRARALEEFRELSGFAEVMEAFADENPLPAVVVLEPRPSTVESELEGLLESLGSLAQVDFAQFDLAWLKRLYAVLRLLERGALVLAALLAVGVILVVGNTMRMGIENRREEIEIAKLFGATNAFIRRPFLYSGLLYGVVGGSIAWLLIRSSLLLLAEPVERLAGLYASSFRLTGLDGQASAVLLAAGALLGLLGSWLSVGRHLGAIEPS